MLTQLFSSHVRVKILKFLILHENEEFSAADIARRTGSIVRSVNKELTKLLTTESIIEITKPLEVNKKLVNVKHYSAQKDFILFKEIYNLFIKLQLHDIETFKEQIKKLGDIRYLMLTGRFMGIIDAAIDLLIVGNINRHKCEKVINVFEKTISWEINWTLMDVDDYLYRREIGDMFIYGVGMSKKVEVINTLD